ncbi:MAG: hypothetical protein AABY22_23295 [Nanoarchaeota archaeon]
MNKKGLTQLQKTGIGLIIGIIGLLIMSFGSFTGQIWILRGGIVLATIGIWLIDWSSK